MFPEEVRRMNARSSRFSSDMTSTPSRTNARTDRAYACRKLDYLVPRHVAVGVVARVWVPGQPNRPVGGYQAEGVPALPPGLPHASAFEHHVLDAGLCELVAGRETRLPSAHHDHIDAFHGGGL
jgi:hypothetical protein